MSCAALEWAVGQRGVGRGKGLLIVLANRAGDDGVCFPGREMLAQEAECHRSTITQQMCDLELRGLIRRCRRQRVNGSRTSDWIVLAPQAVDRGRMTAAGHKRPQQVAALACAGSGAPPLPQRAEQQLRLFDDLKPSASEPCGSSSGGVQGPTHATPPVDVSDIYLGRVLPPGQVAFSGGPEPSEEPSEGREGSARCAREPNSTSLPVDRSTGHPAVLHPQLDAVITILSAAPLLAVEPLMVNSTLISHPDVSEHDVLQAAHYVAVKAFEEQRSSVAHARLAGVLRRPARPPASSGGAPHQGRRRSAAPLSEEVQRRLDHEDAGVARLLSRMGLGGSS